MTLQRAACAAPACAQGAPLCEQRADELHRGSAAPRRHELAEGADAIAEEIEPAWRRGLRVCVPTATAVCARLTKPSVADATEVSDEELPHNSCTAGEIGCARSPAWNSERKIGSVGCGGGLRRCERHCDRRHGAGVRKAREIGGVVDRRRRWPAWRSRASRAAARSPPTDAIAVRVACELAALA